MRLLIFISLYCILNTTKCQKTTYSIGGNTSFAYNKITAGIEINTWKNVKRNKYIPRLTLKINYGLLGYKTYKFQNNIPDKKQVLNYKKAYFSYFRKEIFVGIDLSLTKEIKINSSFFFGVGTGWNKINNKGYELAYNPFTNDSIKNVSTLNFQTVSILSNFGYTKLIKENLIFKSTINFYFFIPFKNREQIYYDSSMPNVGVEIDLSVSLNYLF